MKKGLQNSHRTNDIKLENGKGKVCIQSKTHHGNDNILVEAPLNSSLILAFFNVISAIGWKEYNNNNNKKTDA